MTNCSPLHQAVSGRGGWRRLTALLAAMILPVTATGGDDESAATEHPRVIMDTSLGSITIELDRPEAPATVDNFLRYADDGFYADTVFHRVIPGFMIQGGGLDEDLNRLTTHAPIANEPANALSNERGTIAMARTRDPDSATSQFFINLTDNPNLDGGPGQPGYTVFGRVVDGMDVVDDIAGVETGARGGHQDVPRKVIAIRSVER